MISFEGISLMLLCLVSGSAGSHQMTNKFPTHPADEVSDRVVRLADDGRCLLLGKNVPVNDIQLARKLWECPFLVVGSSFGTAVHCNNDLRDRSATDGVPPYQRRIPLILHIVPIACGAIVLTGMLVKMEVFRH
jgi:hypothetical protein